ncbi:hypothetical protein Cgig2_023477 [Carnegiea gigantea]|uniref:Uncharacterized protein n=1 Tax=Carnegiea gigantea TaxID=171969 RepID=A0A9Q1JIW5_9CARY|nr:hypothetical protein Cgig2_023477 [Carnegiea gigantea]
MSTEPDVCQRKRQEDDQCPMTPKTTSLQPLFGDSTSATAPASDGTYDPVGSPSSVGFPEIKTTRTTAATADYDDRPVTPRSPDSRIPENPPCPHAPMKPKSQPVCKRRRSADHDTNVRSSSRLLDFCKEVESMFSPHLQDNLGRKVKKARSVYQVWEERYTAEMD